MVRGLWQQMGKPDPLRLIELGPGRGTMMRDMLHAARRTPDFLRAVQVVLVETSAPLAAEQRSRLGDAPAPIAWSDALPQAGACASLVVANEFLDALPAHQYVRTEAGWIERAVCLDDGDQLQFCPGAPVGVGLAAMLAQRFADARPSDIAEVAQYPVADWLGAQAERQPTAALLIDYGHTRSALGDTLQAVRRHRPEPPLGSPGEADLTMHVDFAALAAELTALPHLACDGPVTQAEFLGGLGLVERASRLMAANPARALEIETAAQRLLAPGGMGGRFKVLGARSRRMPALPGLAPAALPSS